MNILSINRINTQDHNSYWQRTNSNRLSYGLKLQAPLKADTVSFGCTVKFDKILESTAEKNNQKLLETATVYMDILESIAMKLGGAGVSFDRAYSEPNSIKSAESIVSKIKRSKTFKIPDRIRGTIYCKKIYDLSVLFDQILPELEKRGYIISDAEIPLKEAMKRGYKPSDEEIKRGEIIYPDVDIRLNRASTNASSLPENLKYSLSEPQSSGYEDIQIRLTKKDAAKKTSMQQKTLHELIILTGPEYARTKHYESEKIYSYTRQFKELNIFNNGKEDDETILLIKGYKDIVLKMFSTEITQKLYENAKSQDIYGIVKTMPISLSSDDEKTLTECYDEMERLTKKYYKDMIETKAKSEKARETFMAEKKEDLERLAEVRKGLTEAIEFYKNYPASANDTKKKTKDLIL